VQQQRSRATRVRRPSRPQGDGTQRPLGLPAVEDTLLPRAVARLRAAIYAQDFRRWSAGYRPQGGALDAGETLTRKLPCRRDAGVVEAALQPSCDPIAQEWMVRMCAERLDDGALLRLRRTWLKAGVLATDGQGLPPVTGTPHGGTGSPVLAHGSLHYVLEVWVATVVKRPCRGDACLMRYAADTPGQT
jgi:RNA-directed DNA polymerase